MVNTYILKHAVSPSSSNSAQKYEYTVVRTCGSPDQQVSAIGSTGDVTQSIPRAADQYLSYCQQHNNGDISILEMQDYDRVDEILQPTRTVYAFDGDMEQLLKYATSTEPDNTGAADSACHPVPPTLLMDFLESDLWASPRTSQSSGIILFAGNTSVSLEKFHTSVDSVAIASGIRELEDVRKTPFWQLMMRPGSPPPAQSSPAKSRTGEDKNYEIGRYGTFPRRSQRNAFRERSMSAVESTPRTIPNVSPQDFNRYSKHPT